LNNLLVALVAFFATIVLIVMLQPIARAIGLTDKPNERKQHHGNIPLVGGIAIFLGFSLAALVGPWVSDTAGPTPEKIWVFLGASLILVFAGAWDDLRGLSPLTRFIAQICAALLMVYEAGLVIVALGAHSPVGDQLFLHDWSVPFTVFATVGLINAINMSDGLDGLSGNLALVSFVGFGAANALWGSSADLALLNIMSAAIAGFLVFNQRMHWRSTAAVFLGDAGSMMLGFALAWVAIEVSQGPAHSLTPVATLWFLVVPVYDTMGVIVRRLLAGRSPFSADAQHIHHLLVRAGFSVTATIGILCGFALVGVAIGLFVTWWVVPDWQVLGTFVIGWIIYLLAVQWAWKQKRIVG
jgi:UDP-GlcNAc:undecaprenyl-phosphate GlcNAc-1-phosphate transferase